MNDQDQTLKIAETICEQFAWNGRTFQEGEYVALLDGEIIAVTKNPADAIKVLRSKAPDPKHGMVIEVAHPVVDVIR